MPSHSQISAVRRWKRHLRRLAWTLTMLGLCFLFGRHLLLTWVVAPVAGLALGTSVDVSQASCAPTSRLDLSDLRVGEADNVFIQTGPVEARYRLWRSLFIGPYVERLHATNLTVNLANAPQEKMRLPRFRWFRRKHKEDIEDAEPFLVRDLVLTNSTLLYESDDSPLHMRLEDASVNMPEMRHGTPGQFSVQARIARLDVGPLSLDGGEISGTCTMSHDREMDLQWSTYRFQASNLSGTLDGTPLQGVSLTVEGSGRMQRGRGFRQDITLTFAHDGDPVGTVELSGYYSKNLRGLDVTARLDVGPEFANAALAKLGLPAQAAPHVSVAARLDFPQPGQGRLDAAINVETSGETIADLDLSITSPVPPILQPVQVRITSERLAIDQLLAIYQPSDDQPDEADQPVPPIDSEQAASHPDEALPAATKELLSRLSLPPAILDLDLHGVSYGGLQGSVVALARVHGQRAALDPCTISLGDGTARAVADVAWEQAAPTCRGKVEVEGLDVAMLSAALMDEADGQVTGRLQKLSLSFDTQGASTQDLVAGMNGDVTADLANLQLEDLKSLRRMASRYQLDALRHLRFEQGRLAGRTEDGRFVIDEARLTGPSGRLDLTGSMGLQDRQLNMVLEAGLGDDLLSQLRRVPKYGYLAFFLQSRDGYAYLPTPIPLAGTLGEPDFGSGSRQNEGAPFPTASAATSPQTAPAN